MAAWSSQAVAAPAPARTRKARPQARPRPQARKRRPALLGGVFWIGLVAALLAGVVALNVAVLQLNVRLEQLAHRKAEVRAENALLSAQLSSAASAPQVAARARAKLGLEPATPEQMSYIDLARAHRQ